MNKNKFFGLVLLLIFSILMTSCLSTNDDVNYGNVKIRSFTYSNPNRNGNAETFLNDKNKETLKDYINFYEMDFVSDHFNTDQSFTVNINIQGNQEIPIESVVINETTYNSDDFEVSYSKSSNLTKVTLNLTAPSNLGELTLTLNKATYRNNNKSIELQPLEIAPLLFYVNNGKFPYFRFMDFENFHSTASFEIETNKDEFDMFESGFEVKGYLFNNGEIIREIDYKNMKDEYVLLGLKNDDLFTIVNAIYGINPLNDRFDIIILDELNFRTNEAFRVENFNLNPSDVSFNLESSFKSLEDYSVIRTSLKNNKLGTYVDLELEEYYEFAELENNTEYSFIIEYSDKTDSSIVVNSFVYNFKTPEDNIEIKIIDAVVEKGALNKEFIDLRFEISNLEYSNLKFIYINENMYKPKRNLKGEIYVNYNPDSIGGEEYQVKVTGYEFYNSDYGSRYLTYNDEIVKTVYLNKFIEIKNISITGGLLLKNEENIIEIELYNPHNLLIKSLEIGQVKYYDFDINETNDFMIIKYNAPGQFNDSSMQIVFSKFVILEDKETYELKANGIISKHIGVYIEESIGINTVEQLQNLRNNKMYHLNRDIRFSAKDSENWIPYEFSGAIDGRDYSVKGFEIIDKDNDKNFISKGLFTSLKGTIKNIKFEDSKIEFNNLESETIRIGLLAAFSERSYFENITISNLEINYRGNQLNNDISSVIYIGGLVGYGIRSIYKNINMNNININLADEKDEVVVGGLIGLSGSSVTGVNVTKIKVESSVDNLIYGSVIGSARDIGTFTNNNILDVELIITGGNYYIGGAIGRFHDNNVYAPEITIDNIKVKNIKIEGSMIKNMYFGGIFADSKTLYEISPNVFVITRISVQGIEITGEYNTFFFGGITREIRTEHQTYIFTNNFVNGIILNISIEKYSSIGGLISYVEGPSNKFSNDSIVSNSYVNNFKANIESNTYITIGGLIGISESSVHIFEKSMFVQNLDINIIGSIESDSGFRKNNIGIIYGENNLDNYYLFNKEEIDPNLLNKIHGLVNVKHNGVSISKSKFEELIDLNKYTSKNYFENILGWDNEIWDLNYLNNPPRLR